eukprot:sb/3465129/
MLATRVLSPFISRLPNLQQSATFFPEKKDPPYWLENLTQPGHQKKFPRIYPLNRKVDPLKLLPGDDGVGMVGVEVGKRVLVAAAQKKQKKEQFVEAERPKDIITPEEVHMVVSAKDIMGRWKKLHPITMQINKKPLEHAILQCYFNSTWSPRYKDVLLTLLRARQKAQEGGVTDTSDLWIESSNCAHQRTDKNGITVHAKGKSGSNKRYWNRKVDPLKLLPGDDPQPYQPHLQPFSHDQRRAQKKQKKEQFMEAERPKDIITPEEVHMVVSAKDIMGRWKKLHPITMQINKKPLEHAILQCYFNSTWSPRYKDVLLTLLRARQKAQEGGVTDTSDLWIESSNCAHQRTDKNGITVHAKGKSGSNKRYWSAFSVTVVKGRPSNKKRKLDTPHGHPDVYKRLLDPLPFSEDYSYI